MFRRIPTLIAAVLLAVGVAAPAASQADQANQAPPVAAIADAYTGPAEIPVHALWRDPRVVTRYHLAVAEGVDLAEWVVQLDARSWSPQAMRIELTAPEGAPVAVVHRLPADPDGPLGSAAAMRQPGGVMLEIPGVPGDSGVLEVSFRKVDQPDATPSTLSPLQVSTVGSVSADGLRSPTVPLVVDADGAVLSDNLQVPPGPAVRGVRGGIRISLLEPLPTTIDDRAVETLIDRVLLRASDALDAPIVATFFVEAETVTGRDAAGEALLVDGEPWSAPLRTDGQVAAPSVELTLEELSDLVGEPIDAGSRVGVVRVAVLEDQTRLVADGLDARIDALPVTRQLNRGVRDPDAVDPTLNSGRMLLLVLIGAGIVVAVTLPLLRYQYLARRARRQREHHHP